MICQPFVVLSQAVKLPLCQCWAVSHKAKLGFEWSCSRGLMWSFCVAPHANNQVQWLVLVSRSSQVTVLLCTGHPLISLGAGTSASGFAASFLWRSSRTRSTPHSCQITLFFVMISFQGWRFIRSHYVACLLQMFLLLRHDFKETLKFSQQSFTGCLTVGHIC